VEIDILSLFPEYFASPLGCSMMKRAIEKGILTIRQTNIRDFAEGKHKKVDDRPYGGGPGMVLMPQPTCAAIRSVRAPGTHVVYLSPQGKLLDAATARRLAGYSHLVLLCGHYEGIDERVIAKEVNEEISIGDYVLTNGCLPALVVMDAMARFIPGVLGHDEAASQDSFEEGIFFDAPHYTRPEEFEGVKVPDVLLEGHHEKIRQWRKEQGLQKTRLRRPDLLY
jgi:tRNA (guanine37-N1)-methyltransferase